MHSHRSHRTRFHLISVILTLGKRERGVIISRVCKEIPYARAKEILTLCVNRGLLTKVEKRTFLSKKSGSHKLLSDSPKTRNVVTYHTTEKGEKFINKFKELNKVLGWEVE